MPTMAGEAMALATGAMVDTVWDTPDMVWDTLVPMDMDTAATTLARERLRLSQRPNPRLILMPGMVDMVWDTPDSMVDMVWDTLLVPMDTAVLETAATTLARERLRLSQRPNPRLMLMPGMVHTVWDTLDSMVDTVWDTPDSMVDTVWDTLLVPMDTAVLDTAATTSARERPRLSQRLMLMPTTDMGLDTDTVWDT